MTKTPQPHCTPPSPSPTLPEQFSATPSKKVEKESRRTKGTFWHFCSKMLRSCQNVKDRIFLQPDFQFGSKKRFHKCFAVVFSAFCGVLRKFASLQKLCDHISKFCDHILGGWVKSNMVMTIFTTVFFFLFIFLFFFILTLWEKKNADQKFFCPRGVVVRTPTAGRATWVRTPAGASFFFFSIILSCIFLKSPKLSFWVIECVFCVCEWMCSCIFVVCLCFRWFCVVKILCGVVSCCIWSDVLVKWCEHCVAPVCCTCLRWNWGVVCMCDLWSDSQHLVFVFFFFFWYFTFCYWTLVKDSFRKQ